MKKRNLTTPLMIKPIFIALAAISLFSTQINAQKYEIHSDFGNLAECDTLSKGRFLLWWDKDYPFPKASEVLDNMISFTTECNEDLNMSYPPNSLAGAFVNIYCHSSGDDDYISKSVSGNGVGTENYGTPYQGPYFGSGRNTLSSDPGTVAHEGFHLMQYKTNSPGYRYTGSSAWYTEASASFYGMTRYSDSGYGNVYILRKLPQVPLWLSWGNLAQSSYPKNWQRETRQYGMNIFLYYLYKEKNVSKSIITEGYYAQTDLFPQQYIASKIGIENLRDHFTQFSTMLHNDFEFVPRNALPGALNNFNTYSSTDDIHEYVLELKDQGTSGWYTPKLEDVTTGWSFNTYKLSNTQNKSYTFEINGDPTGSYGDVSHFKGRILVRNSNGNATYYDVPMTSNTKGKITISLTPDEYDAYLVVASVPDRMDDDQKEFQTYGYQVNISEATLSIAENSLKSNPTFKVYPNPVNEKLYLSKFVPWKLFDISGKEIATGKGTELNMNKIDTGFYILKSLGQSFKILKK